LCLVPKVVSRTVFMKTEDDILTCRIISLCHSFHKKMLKSILRIIMDV
jgi:hypothetical protein